MHEEAHDARGEDVVAHEGVPRRPQPLEVVELQVVLGDLVELVPVGVLRVREHRVGEGGVGGIVTAKSPSQYGRPFEGGIVRWSKLTIPNPSRVSTTSCTAMLWIRKES